MFNTTYNNAAIVTENILHMSVNIYRVVTFCRKTKDL